MSTMLVDLQAEHDRALSKADEIISAAERAKRPLSAVENGIVNKCTAQASDLGAEIVRVKIKQIRTQTPRVVETVPGAERMIPATFSANYVEAFHQTISSGQKMSAALEEGTDSAGGYAVPITVDQQIVPLAPSDLAVRNLAMVIPTVSDIKSPGTATLPTATAKSEGSSFGASVPSLNQFTLSAFLAGAQDDISFELAGDAKLFPAFYGESVSLAIQEYEENLFVNGTGTGQPQGLLGNIDTGVSAAVADGGGNLLSIDATFQILGTLKDKYYVNASWLMQRATAIELRRAQLAASLFEPVFTRYNGQDYLHGFPVFYSGAMPAIAAGATPVIFGDFRQGYLIGDRGGPAIRTKVLDQAKAAQGLITLLTYRRTDGRVRLSEALKALTLHS
jgi:HK97 family phage major capsid protein